MVEAQGPSPRLTDAIYRPRTNFEALPVIRLVKPVNLSRIIREAKGC